jgi:ankyrin repeat protein
MLPRWKFDCLLLLLCCIVTAGMQLVEGAPAFAARNPLAGPLPSNFQDQQPRATKTGSVAESQEEPDEEESAPAALELDVSSAGPLIRELYQATRETKEKVILEHLAGAKKLLDEGADVKATDAQGRTALHWTIFGSSYNTKSTIVVAYEEIADALIARGVDINREDVYQDTALDYLLYSPNFEMQTLLIEHSATSGFLAASFHFFNQISQPIPQTLGAAVSLSRKADLAPGQTLSVRLNTPVYCDRSRTGDPIAAAVTYPLCTNGEQIACKPGELLIPPGTSVNGTILFAQKAPDKYSRPRLVLDFSNILHKNGERSPLYARVLSMDNARETVRNNEIFGIIQPHASSKLRHRHVGVRRDQSDCRLHHKKRADGLWLVHPPRNSFPDRNRYTDPDRASVNAEAEGNLGGLASSERGRETGTVGQGCASPHPHSE